MDSIATLAIKNITEKPLLFKIKTTQPNKYTVSPKSGLIPGGGSMVMVLTLKNDGFDLDQKGQKLQILGALSDNQNIEMFSNSEFDAVPKDKIQIKIIKIKVQEKELIKLENAKDIKQN